MRAATKPGPVRDLRVLVVDGRTGAMRIITSSEIAFALEPGDLVIVNDAATLPASLAAQTERGESIELRLVAAVEERRWTVAVLGSGDRRTRTEDRAAPPRLMPGDRLVIGDELTATVRASALAPTSEESRLVDVELALRALPIAPTSAIWSAIYRSGHPVQYAHVTNALALWDVQNVYAGRPWAVEMPSAGRVLRVETLLDLRRRGVAIASVTHAAGLSSIGDAVVDAMLPLPERYEVPDATWEAIGQARARGGRIVAIGTSTVRALEGAAGSGERRGVTDLRIGRGTRRHVVDAVLSGVHESGTSHFALLSAFAPDEVLEEALMTAERAAFLGHELGDAVLVWGTPVLAKKPVAARTGAALVA